MTDGSPATFPLLTDHLGGTCGVLSLDILQLRVLTEELPTLHQCDRVRVYLLYGVPVILWQTADAVRDMQFVFAYYRSARITEEFVVMQQTAGNRVLYRQHADGRRVLLNGSKDLLECRAADKLYLLPLEVEVGSNIVERPYESLNGYSLHFLFLLNKNPAFTVL